VVERLSTDPVIVAITGAGPDLRPAHHPRRAALSGAWRDGQRDFSTGDEAGTEHRFEVEAWTKENGRKQAVELADAVRAALHDARSHACRGDVDQSSS
jgi:hypothetical protein